MLKRGLASIKISLVLIIIIFLVISVLPEEVFAGSGGNGDSGGSSSSSSSRGGTYYKQSKHDSRIRYKVENGRVYSSFSGSDWSRASGISARNLGSGSNFRETSSSSANAPINNRNKAQADRDRAAADAAKARQRAADLRAAKAAADLAALKVRIRADQAAYLKIMQEKLNVYKDFKSMAEAGELSQYDADAMMKEKFKELNSIQKSLQYANRAELHSSFQQSRESMEDGFEAAAADLKKAQEDIKKAEDDINSARESAARVDENIDALDSAREDLKDMKEDRDMIKDSQKRAEEQMERLENELNEADQKAKDWMQLAEAQSILQDIFPIEGDFGGSGKPFTPEMYQQVKDLLGMDKDFDFDTGEEAIAALYKERNDMQTKLGTTAETLKDKPTDRADPLSNIVAWYASQAGKAMADYDMTSGGYEDAVRRAQAHLDEENERLEDADAIIERAKADLETMEENPPPKDEDASVTTTTIVEDPEYVGGKILEKTSQEGSCTATYAGGTRCGYGNTITIEARYKYLPSGTYYASIVLGDEGCEITYNIGDGTSTENKRWRKRDQVYMIMGGSFDYRIYEIDWEVETGDIPRECFGKTVKVDSIKLYEDTFHTQFVV